MCSSGSSPVTSVLSSRALAWEEPSESARYNVHLKTSGVRGRYQVRAAELPFQKKYQDKSDSKANSDEAIIQITPDIQQLVTFPEEVNWFNIHSPEG